LPKRKANSPWGSNYKEGLPTTSVNDSIDIDQLIRPTVDAGVISEESGQWEGIKTLDSQFIGITIALGIANGGDVSFPDTDAYPSIDMTGYRDLAIALNPSNGGNYSFTVVNGPDTIPNGGLSPVAAGVQLNGAFQGEPSDEGWYAILYDGTQSMQADKWNILMIEARARNQGNLQLKIVNNSGGSSDMMFAFRRFA